MSDERCWPCGHIDRKSCNYTGREFGPWVYDGSQCVPSRWMVCPECFSKRPKQDNEIDLLYQILKFYAIQNHNVPEMLWKIINWHNKNANVRFPNSGRVKAVFHE